MKKKTKKYQKQIKHAKKEKQKNKKKEEGLEGGLRFGSSYPLLPLQQTSNKFGVWVCLPLPPPRPGSDSFFGVGHFSLFWVDLLVSSLGREGQGGLLTPPKTTLLSLETGVGGSMYQALSCPPRLEWLVLRWHVELAPRWIPMRAKDHLYGRNSSTENQGPRVSTAFSKHAPEATAAFTHGGCSYPGGAAVASSGRTIADLLVDSPWGCGRSWLPPARVVGD